MADSFSDSIRKWRAEMPHAELARKAGVSRRTVMRLKSGDVESVTFDTVNRLAKALNVDADVLVTFER